MECRPVCCFLLLLLLLRILIKNVGIKMKIFEAHISACILARAMKLLVQAPQHYTTLPKSSLSSSLLLKLNRHKAIFQSLIHSPICFKGQSSMH